MPGKDVKDGYVICKATACALALAIETEGTPKGNIAICIFPHINIFFNITVAISKFNVQECLCKHANHDP